MSNVDITIRTIDKSSGDTKKIVGSFTELNSAIALARRGLEAMKKAYDFSKAGAEIEFTKTKFDRLAVSIGTTSKVLLGDLKVATRGMYSDMELMASTTDLVGLGLANTHDEAVRLARVASGLNMNMNQLVLTLTNMTTMRFDALGVSVDGFKEKVSALEKTGMDSAKAFKEAFLEQAEQQLQRVGEAADSPLGSFMKLEASVKNLGDTAKEAAAEGLLPLVNRLNDLVEAENAANKIEQTHSSYIERAREILKKQTGEANIATRQAAALARELENQDKATAAATARYQGLADAYAKGHPAAETATMDAAAFKSAMDDLSKIMGTGGIGAAQDDYNAKIAEYNQELEKTKKLEARKGILEKIQAETEAYREKAAAIAYSITQQQIEAAITLDPSKAKEGVDILTSLAGAYGLIDETQKTLINRTSTMVNNWAEGKVSANNLTGALGVMTSQIAGVALVTGPTTEAINGVAGAEKELENNAHAAHEKMSGMENKIKELDGLEATATINIVVNGSIPKFPKQNPSFNVNEPGHSFGAMAEGGHWTPGMWAIVGDAPGGKWTDTTEVITPRGDIIPNPQAMWMRDMGLLSGTPSFGDIDSTFSGYYPSPGAGLPSHKHKSRSSTPSRSTDRGGATSIPVSTLTAVTGEVTQAQQAQQQATVANVAAIDKQTNKQEMGTKSLRDEMRGLRGDLRVLTDTIVDSIGAAVQKGNV